jgi:hypothetical protein
VQSPGSKRWDHYFCGWFGDVPRFSPYRPDALEMDREIAEQLVDQLDTRYRRVVQHSIEELP